MRRFIDTLMWLCMFLCLGGVTAWAHDPSSPNASWYNTAQLMPKAQERLGFMLCCSSDDVVHTKFKVDTTTGGDEWYYEKDDAWVRIPDDIIHWNESAPDGQATLFALKAMMVGHPAGTLTCFFPPQGGL